MDNGHLWLGIGFFGQSLFSARFVVQWLVSEKRRRSVTPVAFWYFSLAGGVVLLSYAIHRQRQRLHRRAGGWAAGLCTEPDADHETASRTGARDVVSTPSPDTIDR